VLSKRVAGKTNRVIGKMLNLSMKIVETHRAAAMRKLALSSTAELVRYARPQEPKGQQGALGERRKRR